MTPGKTFIAVDIGNSSTKLAWFDLLQSTAGCFPVPTDVVEFRTDDAVPDAIRERLSSEPSIWRVASVERAATRRLETWVKEHRPDDYFTILTYLHLPLRIAVDFPERVGMDRLAAALAANALREAGRPAIVVDAGSAVTVDLVSGDGAFQGGVILAGFRMQAHALFGGADLLPLTLLEPTAEPPAVIGKNTEGAIRSGLFWGAVGAVREVVQRMTAELGREPHVYVTGGDLRRLAPLLGQHAEFIPNMVLAGIRLAADPSTIRRSFMPTTPERVLKLCRILKDVDQAEKLTLVDYLQAIPKLDSLADVPAGMPVLVRGDVDAKVGAEVGQGDIRLRSMKETLDFGRQKGWKQIVFGHLGRKEKDKPIGSLAKVAARLGQILGTNVTLIEDWLDESSGLVKDHVQKTIAAAASGSVFVLQNVRGYDIETVLWKAKEDALAGLAPKLAALANSIAEKVAAVYVNEALSAGSLDASSTIVPLAMQRVALGKYIEREFTGPMQDCLKARLVIFSGIKIDKLDDLEAMIERGTIGTIFSAGSLAMALTKAAALLEGKDFCLGVTEDPGHSDKPYYIPPQRIEQAKRMLAAGKSQGIEFVLPIDFVLTDGSVVEKLKPADQQFDIGPKTTALFERKIGDFIAAHRTNPAAAAVFHNGVFGMFEDPRYEAGTKAFIAQLKRLTDAGHKVYVGGGEGGTALEKYGQPNWVTHCFTAGGTVLNALGSQPVPYLVALRAAAKGNNVARGT